MPENDLSHREVFDHFNDHSNDFNPNTDFRSKHPNITYIKDILKSHTASKLEKECVLLSFFMLTLKESTHYGDKLNQLIQENVETDILLDYLLSLINDRDMENKLLY